VRFRLLCFDLDGTLVDSQADIRDALRVALRAVPPGDPALDEQAVNSAGLGLPLEEFFALARPALHAAADASARALFIDSYRVHYHAHLLERTRPFDGVVESLAALHPYRAAGLKVAVATTKKTETAVRVLRGLDLAHHFDAILGTERGMPHKPAPDLLHLAARTVDRPVTSGLMVGDTDRDLRAGRAAGMKTCGVSWGVQGKEGLSLHAPDFLIDRFPEILALLGAPEPASENG
jgi:phosphoglycolate phosphatase